MSDPIAAVTEAEASGETAAIFADIRAVYGVSVVNLIWRHLAVFPGALPWAWATVRPLYLDGTIARQAAALRAARQLPALPMLPPEACAAAGLGMAEMARIGTVLDSYERTNPMALIALSVLEQRLAGAEAAAGPVESAAPVPEAGPELRLPALLGLGQMAPETVALVRRLNGIGTDRSDPILVSMYRHLAHWPPYLALAWALLAPLHADGRLQAAIAAAWRQAQRQALAILAGGAAPRDITLPPDLPAVADAIARFTGDAICRMVVVCGTLRAATPAG
jgi:hypothetical protein